MHKLTQLGSMAMHSSQALSRFRLALKCELLGVLSSQ
jgi:hypothetical protein